MKKKAGLKHGSLWILGLLILVACSCVLADNSLPTRNSKSKFDPALISYVQNITRAPVPLGRSPMTIQTVPQNKVPVIITMYSRADSQELSSFLKQNGASIKFSYELIDAIAADVPASNMESLGLNEHVKNVYLDRKIQLEPQNASYEQTIYENYQSDVNSIKPLSFENKSFPFLNESTTYIGAPYVWNVGFDGTGTTIAILDTGIDDTHPDLAGKVVAKRDFTLFDNELKTDDGFGHGTHCAGIAAGTGAASIKSTQTSSTDTSALSNLPYPPNTYHVGKEKLQLEEGASSKDYYILVVGNIPSVGEAFLNGTWPDNYFDFETNNIDSDWRTTDFLYDNLSKKFYSGYWWHSLLDLGVANIDSTNCPQYDWQIYNSSAAVVVNHTYCVYTSKTNLVMMKISKIGQNSVKFKYKWQGPTPPVVFFDEDGNFNTKEDQYIASNGYHIKKAQRSCYTWGYCYHYVSPKMVYNLSSNFNSLEIIMDFNGDDTPDYMRGVAPGAKLLNGKVLSDQGYGYDSSIIAGIEWAVLNKATVISMSLGGPQNICDGNDPIAQAVEKAYDMNVTVVVAAGNSGYWGRETVASPGCADKIITVGASTKKYPYNAQVADFSSQGPTSDGRIKPDMLAPGDGIIAPQARNTMLGYSPLDGYISLSGTSMATPHVAGAVALLKQAFPSLTPKQVKEILMSTATDLMGVSIFREGAGIINVENAYYSIWNPRVSPSELNLIMNGKQTKTVNLKTQQSYQTTISAYENDLNEEHDTFSGIVDRTNGFYYNFTVPANTLELSVNISWVDKANDVDMRLRDPSGYYYYSGAGWTDFEKITLNNPTPGSYSLFVYPWNVPQPIAVQGSMNLKNQLSWDWFSYDRNAGLLTINPNTEETGLYAGKLFLKDYQNYGNWTYSMIPVSIIISDEINFTGEMRHSFISNPCSGGGSSGGWSSSGSSTESYASFDGSFCSNLERRAYSFTITDKVPYFYISADWWTQTEATYGTDIRMFLYDPTGSLYSSYDYDGPFEWAFVSAPAAGQWTVVIQSEYTPLDGIIFRGDVTIPSILFNPNGIWLNLEQGQQTTQIINITNMLNYDLDVSIEKSIWRETPISVVPNSALDNDKAGPFIYSYRYYNFEIPESYVNGANYLKSKISSQGDALLDSIEAYIYDANGVQIGYSGNYYSNSLLGYSPIPATATAGTWTIVVLGQGFYYDQYPFEIELSLLDMVNWDWAQVQEPTSYFRGTDKMLLTLNVPRNLSLGDKFATLFLNGGWWEGKFSDRRLYRTLSVAYPITLTIDKGCVPSPEVCDGKDNDCDGRIDNGLNQTQACGVGICVGGSQMRICQNGNWGQWNECSTTKLAHNEICNGLDDDCDGVLDGSELITRQCGASNIGICTFGIEKCDNNGNFVNCSAMFPQPEVCGDGIDQNCDGKDCPKTFTVYSPKRMNYSYSSVRMNLSLIQSVQTLKYIDYSEVKPIARTLCSKCNQYGFTRKQETKFTDGYHKVSIFSNDNIINTTIELFVDSTKPKVISQLAANKGYCNGNFVVKYTELYPINVDLNYGGMMVNRKDCPAGTNQQCNFFVNLSNWENQNIYWSFGVKDTFSTVAYKPSSLCKIDTIPSHILYAQSRQDKNYLFFNVSLDEKANYIKYVDRGPKKPVEVTLCSKCIEFGKTKIQKKSFGKGFHNLTVFTEDAAGNRDTRALKPFTVI
ncbi:MAG: S8 family serine peptidase [Candidatus Woesearchaeota archaeon]